MAKRQKVIALERSEPAEPRWDTVLAELVELDAGRPVVVLDGERRVCVAATVALATGDVGRRVTVAFLGGDAEQAIVTGLLQHTGQPRTRPAKLELDAKELELSADRQITLRCGKSSIILTHDGRIVIRGEHLLSRATSVNRIRGGTIQLN
jgi:uncharacterized protein DUF6484